MTTSATPKRYTAAASVTAGEQVENTIPAIATFLAENGYVLRTAGRSRGDAQFVGGGAFEVVSYNGLLTEASAIVRRVSFGEAYRLDAAGRPERIVPDPADVFTVLGKDLATPSEFVIVAAIALAAPWPRTSG